MIGVTPIVSEFKNNLVLFPSSIEYYENKIMKMIELEQHDEMANMLSWLLAQSHIHPEQSQKFLALQQWLKQVLDSDEHSSLKSEDFLAHNANLQEKEFLKNVVNEKLQRDEHYHNQLVHYIYEGTFEQQILSLEQLAFIEIEDDEINLQLKTWLTNEPINPFLQFKALQTLKIRQCSGKIHFKKNEETIIVEIADTPLDFNEFPNQTSELISMININIENHFPDLVSFAEQTLHEFLIFYYGTDFYQKWMKMNSSELRVWAATLHAVIFKMIYSKVDFSELEQQYAISSNQKPLWDNAYTYFCKFT
jgi:hypothetical protein